MAPFSLAFGQVAVEHVEIFSDPSIVVASYTRNDRHSEELAQSKGHQNEELKPLEKGTRSFMGAVPRQPMSRSFFL
jgi:hypothetical protein